MAVLPEASLITELLSESLARVMLLYTSTMVAEPLCEAAPAPPVAVRWAKDSDV